MGLSTYENWSNISTRRSPRKSKVWIDGLREKGNVSPSEPLLIRHYTKGDYLESLHFTWHTTHLLRGRWTSSDGTYNISPQFVTDPTTWGVGSSGPNFLSKSLDDRKIFTRPINVMYRTHNRRITTALFNGI